VTLTTHGWALALTGLIAVAAAALFGIQELYPGAAAAAALLAFGAAWVRGHRPELDSERRLHPARISAGESARVELTVTNRSRRRSPILAGRDPFGRPGHGSAFRLAPLPPGARLAASYRLPARPRGRYLIGPLQLSLTDPFGLVRQTRVGAAASRLTVHPSIVAVVPAPMPEGSDRFGRAGQVVSGPGGEEFSSLRPYREGDDLRQVHWPSTARLDRVMIRQADAVARPRCTVAIDLRAASWVPALLEEALAAAGGVLDAARRANVEIRVVTTSLAGRGGLDTGFGASGPHWGRVLDALAGAQVGPAPGDGRVPLAGLLRPAAHRARGSTEDTLTVITSSRATDADRRGLGRLAPPPSLILVVFAHPDGSPPSARPPGRCVWVPGHDGFASAWSEAAAPWARLVES
jgi:uncharacterized protein (DUF58 family)